MCWWHCSVAVAPPKTRTQNNPTKFEFRGGRLRVSIFFWSKHVLDTGATDSRDFGSGCNNGFVEYQPNKKQTST